ncbi:MAG TPA: hypothetical protein VF120_12155, partial [Ktedonobacterales bacterium]
GVRFFAHPPLPGRLLGTQVHHSPHPVSPPPAPDGPEWSFTLRGPEIWLGGSARGWDQSKLFAVLGRLAAVNHRAEVVSQYERELLDWKCA